jgi:hypothetical protein
MSDEATDKATDRLKCWPWGTILAILALIVFVLFVVWQLAFHYGSRQSNDLLLASPNAADEVIQLRAQLEEARSYQTTLLTVVLASFAAGFTVLSVVNFAVLFIARRDYEREEKRMRESLILEAEKRDAAEAKRADAELAKIATALSKRFDERNQELKVEQKELRSRVAELMQDTISHYKSWASLREQMTAESKRRQNEEWQGSAMEALRAGDYDQAAKLRGQILQSELSVPGGNVSWSNITKIVELIDYLEKIETPLLVQNATLETLGEVLSMAQRLEGLNDSTASEIARGINLIEAIQERLIPSGIYGAVPPPNLLRVPPTETDS